MQSSSAQSHHSHSQMGDTPSKNQEKLQEMLSSPTNNFGLAQLLANFVLIDPCYQMAEVSPCALSPLLVC